MFNGDLRGYRIGSRNEVYPGGISEGFSGYSFNRAQEMKKIQEDLMQDSPTTVEIRVDIEPIDGRKDEYLVRNTSTYVSHF